MLRSLIHFELIFVQGERQGSRFSLLHVDIQFSQHHLLKRLSLLYCVFSVFIKKQMAQLCISVLCSSGLRVWFCARSMLFSYYGSV
jgi:hypothetical protein